MKNDKKILIAAAAGAAAGVVAGILMAPNNGKDSRESILKAASQLADSVNGQIAPYLEKLSGLSAILGGAGAGNGASKANDTTNSTDGNNTGTQSQG